MEIPVPSRGNPYLFVGNWISIFYLEQQDTEDLADLHLRDALCDWRDNGNVSVRARYDHSQCGGFRPRLNWGERETIIRSPPRGPRIGHWVQSSWADAGYLLSITGNGVAIFATG